MARSFTTLLIGTALAVVFAQTSLAETPARVQTPLRGDFEDHCSKSCIAKDKGAEYCVAYCTCMTREIYLGRPAGEVDKLHAAMQPQAPESNEKEILKRLVSQCVGEGKGL